MYIFCFSLKLRLLITRSVMLFWRAFSLYSRPSSKKNPGIRYLFLMLSRSNVSSHVLEMVGIRKARADPNLFQKKDTTLFSPSSSSTLFSTLMHVYYARLMSPSDPRSICYFSSNSLTLSKALKQRAITQWTDCGSSRLRPRYTKRTATYSTSYYMHTNSHSAELVVVLAASPFSNSTHACSSSSSSTIRRSCWAAQRQMESWLFTWWPKVTFTKHDY